MLEIVKPQNFVTIVLLLRFHNMIGDHTIIIVRYESEIRSFP